MAATAASTGSAAIDLASPDEATDSDTFGAARRSGRLRLAIGALFGLIFGLLGSSGALSSLDLTWEWARYLGPTATSSFSTMTLLSIHPEQTHRARRLYTELLELINARGVTPRLVAIDAWISDERRPEDARLIQALAASIERFPVLFGLDADRLTGVSTPPPAWFTTQLDEALRLRAQARCAPPGTFAKNPTPQVKACVDEMTHTYQVKHLLWGGLRIEQPRSILEPMGLRIPLLRRTGGDAAQGMVFRRPHFAVLLAWPERGGIDPASGLYRSADDPSIAVYDQRGYLPVIFLGKAVWDGDERGARGAAAGATARSVEAGATVRAGRDGTTARNEGDGATARSEGDGTTARSESDGTVAQREGAAIRSDGELPASRRDGERSTFRGDGAGAAVRGEGLAARDLEQTLAAWRASSAGDGVGADPAGTLRQLNDMRVLIGAAAPPGARKGNEMDQYRTPLGRMFGVEVHANVAEALLRREVPRPVGVPLALAGAALAGVAGAWLGARARWPRALTVALMLLVLGSSYVLFSEAMLYWPPTAALLALLCGATVARFTASRRAAIAAAAALVFALPAAPAPARATSVPATTEVTRPAPAAADSGPARPASAPADSGPATPASARSDAAPVVEDAGLPTPTKAPPWVKASPTGRRVAQSGAKPPPASIARPAPPTVPAAPRIDAGWRLVYVRPAALLGSPAVTVSSGALAAGGPIRAGATLRSTDERAEVLLEYIDPGRGMVAHQALFGTFEATLGERGELEFNNGSIWTRLFRYLEQSTGILSVTYDGTPAGFGSTEVVYDRAGRSGRDLNVIEGRVLYTRAGREEALVAGQRARWGRKPGSPAPIPPDQLKAWIDRGTRLELDQLPADQTCATRSEALSGATLASRACFDAKEARDRELAAGRTALAGKMDASSWRRMGDAYLAARRLPQAADSYRRGIRDGGDAGDVARMQLELGNIRWATGEADQARTLYEAAVKSDPGLAGAWNNLGVMYWRQGDVEGAKRALQRATELDPKQFQGWRNLGRVSADKPDQAIAAWERAAQLEPADAGLWKDLGAVYADSRRFDQAVQAAQKSAQIDPKQPELWYALASWYWEQGRKAESIDAYERGQALEIELQRK